MVNHRLKWIRDGRQHTSAVTYDQPSAEARKERLEASEATVVEIVPVKPGE
jgi:hypothetical protein